MQRHDIEKRRLDSHGNIIEARKEGIGGAKVSVVGCIPVVKKT